MRLASIACASMLASAPLLSADDLPDIVKRGVLRPLATVDEAPELFNVKGSGEPGFEREIIEGFARLKGLRVEPVVVKRSDDRIPTLEKGDADLIIGIVNTESRRKLVDFSSEVLPARHVTVSRKPGKPIASVEELRAARVGVLTGTSWAEAAVEAGVPGDKTEKFPGREALFEALRTGKITATVMSVSDFTLEAKRDPALEAGVFLGQPGQAGFAVRKTSPELRAALDEYLGNLRKGPSWSRLLVKYFGEKALTVLGRARE